MEVSYIFRKESAHEGAMVKTMNMKKALAGMLLSIVLAGGVVPASVALANDETTPAAPTTEVVTEAPAATEVAVNEAATTEYPVGIEYMDLSTDHPSPVAPVKEFEVNAGIHIFKPVEVEGYEYTGEYSLNGRSMKGNEAVIDTSTLVDP